MVDPSGPASGNGERAALMLRARAAFGIGREGPLGSFVATLRDDGVGPHPVFASLLLAFSSGLPVGAVVVSRTDAAASLGASSTSVSAGLVLGLLVAAAACIPLAVLAAGKHRRHQLFAGTALVWALATVAAAFAGRAPVLLLLVLVATGATAGVRALGEPLVVDVTPPAARARALALYLGAAIAGVAFGAMLAGELGNLGWTWRGSLLFVGALCLFLAGARLRLRDVAPGTLDADRVAQLLRTPSVRARSVDPDDDAGLDLGLSESLRSVMLVPAVRKALGPLAVLGMLLLPLQLNVGSALVWRWGVDAANVPLTLGLLLALAVLPIVAVGWAADHGFRRSPAAALRPAVGAAAAGAVLLGAGPLVEWLPLGVVFIGLGVGGVLALQPVLVLTILNGVPANLRCHAAALAGIFTFALGGLGGIVYIGMVAPRFGPDAALALLAVPALLAVSATVRLAPLATDAVDHRIEEVFEMADLEHRVASGVRLPMLSCQRIDFSYGQLQVLFDVEMSVEEGEMVALLGTNGAGKSTLLRVISGLGLPSRGTVHLDGRDITHLDAERRLPLGISQIPGGKAVFGPLSVVENLRVYGHALGRNRSAVDAGIETTFDAFPRLSERRNQLASTLSGGEQQMLALGKALILEPRLLLIDELSLGLAPKIVGELLELVRVINARGTAVVLVEQSVNVALSLVERAYFMEKGQVRFEGPAQELLERRDILRSVFLEGAAKGLG